MEPDEELSNYERARRAGKSWIRAQAEDKPLTFTGVALLVGIALGAVFI